jgi:hypothetical protein
LAGSTAFWQVRKALRTRVEHSRAGTRRPRVHRRVHLLPTNHLQEALEPELAPGLGPVFVTRVSRNWPALRHFYQPLSTTIQIQATSAKALGWSPDYKLLHPIGSAGEIRLDVGSMRPVSIFTVVLLPAPLGPR